MTGVTLVLWQVLLWGVLGIALLVVTALWLFIVYAVIRLIAEFMKAYSEADKIDNQEELEF